MRVVFLDLDGVVCTDKTYRETEEAGFVTHVRQPSGALEKRWTRLDLLISERRVRLVQQICEAADGFVLSSTWRTDPGVPQTLELLRSKGLTAPFLGETPTQTRVTFRNRRPEPSASYPIQFRGDEIHEWLVSHPTVTNIVILDDDDRVRPYLGFHLKTSERDGIRPQDIRRALRILGQPFQLKSEEV